jgi:hypothetical protein
MTHEEIEAAIERLRGMKISSRDFIVDVCRAFIGNGEVTGDELHYTLIELLEQADPNMHMAVPVDANGEPIHVGDKMRWRDGETFEVNAISSTTLYYYDETSGRMEWTQAADKYHYHKPTVEDVLREFSCVLMGKREFDGDVTEAVAEYAKKLRLRED